MQPIEVLSLLRVYGYHWDTNLYTAAVLKGNLELIMWLHQVHCPAPLAGHIAHKCCTCTRLGAVSILQWLHSLQPEWFSQRLDNATVNKTWLLGLAGQHCNLAVMQWLRCDVKAEWPEVADIICNEDDCTVLPTWSVKAVIWALDNGLEFEFDCSKLNSEKHIHEFDKEEATVLWQWLHKERTGIVAHASSISVVYSYTDSKKNRTHIAAVAVMPVAVFINSNGQVMLRVYIYIMMRTYWWF
jgi:hypothetical protein